MTIKEQFRLLTRFFEQENLDYAITRIEYQKKIIAYLESLGFKTLNCSVGFSNHLHSIGSVRIDVVYIGGETANIVFKSTKKKIVFENLELPVVSPEHLIALKLFAIQNEPDRKYKELADIKEIFRLTKINQDRLEVLFKKYGLGEYYHEITGKKTKE